VLVLQNAGPRACGMPEAGYLPIPAKLARAGVTTWCGFLTRA
jgi:dihydroxy-acid dehydratase